MECFNRFKSDISGIELPLRFNNPFYYSPHPLCLLAADEARAVLDADEALSKEAGKGKMFGVLVVRDASGVVGYLKAFSGLLFGRNVYEGFVPPVFDMQEPQGYFKREEASISAINKAITDIEHSDAFLLAVEAVEAEKRDAEKRISEKSALFQANRQERRRKRNLGSLTHEEENSLIKESQFEKAELKRLRRSCEMKIAEKEKVVTSFKERVFELKTERRNRSVALQQWLFEQFVMLDANGVGKNLIDIFAERLSAMPPAGAGECAAPKLLQYAYMNSLEPLALAEFWVGISPAGEVRRDGCFYGACKSKCEPILGHMLQGLDVEESALEKGGDIDAMDIVYEDEYLVVVNKPPGVLSVPGIIGGMSVQQWLRDVYLHSNELFVAHRLDMATSGLLVAAKSIEVYKALQRQFAEQQVKKRYLALVDGVPKMNKGVISLPLSSDYLNRPRQKVDYINGKEAVTNYEVIGARMYNGKKCSLVCFAPVTGRTHQLRVHAASREGLDSPIVGDALYGAMNKRLMLHAASLCFYHPVNGSAVELDCECDFGISMDLCV